LPGAVEQTSALVADWRACERLLARDLVAITGLRSLVSGVRLTSADGLLERQQRAVLADLGRSERVVRATDEVAESARRWLESYRRHYLAWHARVHSAARFEALSQLRRSALFDALRRLGQAGLRAEAAASIDAAIGSALAKRCLAGDPLPEGRTTCALCGIGFKQDLDLPDPGELAERAAGLLKEQLSELSSHADLLRRRLAALTDGAIRVSVAKLLEYEESAPPDALAQLLTDNAIAWLRQQLGQPKAQRRSLRDLEARLRGKELTPQEVLRIVEEWLGEGEGYVRIE
jgi:hypothetical protein